ncbi:hypothetical protein KY284_026195 [Solanum tuberosum]|nr:hypothetical protein KY284_026195 [Solanum tuberosum]
MKLQVESYLSIDYRPIPKIACIVIKWLKPPENLVKINTDGSRDANGRAGTGGIYRDHRGKLSWPFLEVLVGILAIWPKPRVL